MDWTPFFRAWELAGNYPAILTDPIAGESATGLFADAQAMFDRIIEEKWLTARGVAALWRCRREGDDILVTARNEEVRSEEHTSELQSLLRSSYAVFCLNKQNHN